MKKYVYLLVSGVLLTSCSNALKHDLGLMREVPDEFKVISEPDLSIPPDFDLVPPAYPLKSHKFVEPNKEPIIQPHKHDSVNNEEKEFLNAIALPEANHDIKRELENSRNFDNTKPKGIFQKIKSILNPSDREVNEVVAPIEENKRIQGNISNNKSITEGEVVSNKEEKSVIDRIMGK